MGFNVKTRTDLSEMEFDEATTELIPKSIKPPQSKKFEFTLAPQTTKAQDGEVHFDSSQRPTL